MFDLFSYQGRVLFDCRVVFLHEVVGMIVFQGLKTWTSILQLGKSCHLDKPSSLKRYDSQLLFTEEWY